MAEWALRLGQHRQALIDAAAQVMSPASAGVQVAQGGSYLAQDGSVWLRADDVATVREALFHAAAEGAGPLRRAPVQARR